jgi:hypothetical protein
MQTVNRIGCARVVTAAKYYLVVYIKQGVSLMTTPKTSLPASKMTKYQKFASENVSRQSIQGAPYNPRQIDQHAARKLKANIQKVGLLAPILVNRRSGNVVSGHQRLAALDALEGKPDYLLQVSYCDLSPKQEREQNIFMNNEAAMGSWDLDLLNDMVTTNAIDITLAGFEDADLQLLLPDWTPLGDNLGEDTKPAEEKSAEQQAADIKIIKERKKESMAVAREKDDTEFFMVTVFRTRDEMDKFLDSINVARTLKYVSPAVLIAGVEGMLAKKAVKRAKTK